MPLPNAYSQLMEPGTCGQPGPNVANRVAMAPIAGSGHARNLRPNITVWTAPGNPPRYSPALLGTAQASAPRSFLLFFNSMDPRY